MILTTLLNSGRNNNRCVHCGLKINDTRRQMRNKNHYAFGMFWKEKYALVVHCLTLIGFGVFHLEGSL